ncbi:Double-stranded RNA-binding protein [Corchorus olitorius]|uniref:Double-stranded RNA-binding protein n=1 Tax=Corchorus olitorius TaxID=93759 RepID=A0A1R3JX24_9ROSI|nr:Double-stranded RNA-binding protein [Corchorus olitorius]
MFKNQLQELAQRSCFNLPSYACIREGPDHAPRFKASVNFNGEIFESPSYCPTLRQAEHAAAEVALNKLSSKGPSRSLTARVLDETGIYKNLLQETAHRAGLNLPVYTTVRSGPGHVPIFTCTVELAGMNFTGEPAKTKKQAEKNAAIAAWSALKRMPRLDSLTNKESDNKEDQDQAVVSRVLSSFKPKDVETRQQQFRRRDFNFNHHQAKRRMVKGNRDISSPSSSSSSSSTSGNGNSLFHQQWRLMDLLMDSGMDGSSSTQKQNSFVSLLPPPPPRTASKILPPSNRPIPVQIRGKTEVKLPPPPPPPPPPPAVLEEHLKDEEEWLGVKSIEKEGNLGSKSNVFGVSSSSSSSCSNSIYRPAAIPFSSGNGKLLNSCMIDNATKIEANQIISRLIGSPNPSQMAQNMYNCGGFSPHRMAPAVKIRSVIPVCAAPPPPPAAAAAAPPTTRPPQESTTTTTENSVAVFNKSSSNSKSEQLSTELKNLKL